MYILRQRFYDRIKFCTNGDLLIQYEEAKAVKEHYYRNKYFAIICVPYFILFYYLNSLSIQLHP